MPVYLKTPKIRLFIDNPLEEGTKFLLGKDDSHYLLNVMRLCEGKVIAIFNGRDGEWAAEVSRVSKKKALATVKSKLREQGPEADVWLVFAPIKKARIDFMAQRACELGVSSLKPVMTKNTVMGRVKIERLEANAKEAAEQCGRLMVPEVSPIIKLQKLMDAWPKDRHIMFCDEDLSGHSALDSLKSKEGEKWAIFIGPEGGWSEEERKMIKCKPLCVTVSLGPRVLRADTAAISALTLFQSTLGDW
ncbi:MAG: 16S rRNA (uracil(1498)-N(3))-methyltransferase [Sphingomonadales bacterium]